MSLTTINVITVSFDRLALAVVFALAIAILWLAAPSSYNEAAKRLKLLAGTLVVMVFTTSTELLLRTANLADVSPLEAWDFIPRVLFHSDYGTYWQGRMFALCVMVAVGLWIWRKRWSVMSAAILFAAALVIALFQSVASHAGEEGLWSVSNIVNWLHLVSTSLWGGTVVLYALLVLPTLRNTAASDQVLNSAERLSTLATIALLIVLLSGFYNTWHQLYALSDLWLTDYGIALVIKLGLVSIMLMIGALNRFRFVPHLVTWQRENSYQWGKPYDRFLNVLRIDSLVFISVMVAALVLAVQQPPTPMG